MGKVEEVIMIQELLLVIGILSCIAAALYMLDEYAERKERKMNTLADESTKHYTGRNKGAR